MNIKLSTYATRVGVTWKTANRWFHNGQIPGAWQTETGRIFVPDDIFDDEQRAEKTVIYARVSSHDQRGDLERQVERLTQFCIANGYQIDVIEKEIASGVNDKRKKLLRTLSDPGVTRIVVEHKDRLTRFGFNYIQTLCDRDNIELIVVNKAHDDKTDLVEDMIAIVTSFCARLYGSRKATRIKTGIVNAIDAA
jgi:putative resolvase